jgi:selenocysteine-specific elongation factor
VFPQLVDVLRNAFRLALQVRSRLKVKPAVFQSLLAQATTAEKIVEAGPLVHLPRHAVTFSPEQQAAIDRTLADFANAGVNSPQLNEVKERLGEDVFYALLELGKLVQIGSNVLYTQETYQAIIERIIAFLRQNGRINAAQLRDLLGASRKYAISLLEHLDQRKITRRVNDDRELY